MANLHFTRAHLSPSIHPSIRPSVSAHTRHIYLGQEAAGETFNNRFLLSHSDDVTGGGAKWN